MRSELLGQRTAKGNQIRGLVAEYGLVAPRELCHLRRAIPSWLEDAENGLSERFRRLLHGLWGDLRRLDERIDDLDHEIMAIAQDNATVQRLQQLRGVGPITATALVATVGELNSSPMAARWPPLWGLHLDNVVQEEKIDCWGSVSAVTVTSGPC